MLVHFQYYVWHPHSRSKMANITIIRNVKGEKISCIVLWNLEVKLKTMWAITGSQEPLVYFLRSNLTTYEGYFLFNTWHLLLSSYTIHILIFFWRKKNQLEPNLTGMFTIKDKFLRSPPVHYKWTAVYINIWMFRFSLNKNVSNFFLGCGKF
jgi:hypothetical protein